VSYRVAVMVSGEGTNLQALLDTVHRREGIEIVAVASNRPDARALDRARRHGADGGLHATARSRAGRDEAMGDWFDSKGVDLVVLAGFMEILSPEFVKALPPRMINVHPSLSRLSRTWRNEQALEYRRRRSTWTGHAR